MTYIGVEHEASMTKWWSQATSSKASNRMASAVADWRNWYLLRRRKEDVLKGILKDKFVKEIQVRCYSGELSVYANIETMLLKTMESYREDEARWRTNLEDILMALMSLCRGCLVHPMIPNGREITKCFSPSRRDRIEGSIEACVYCNGLLCPTVRAEKTVDKKEESFERARGPRTNFELDNEEVDDGENINDDQEVLVQRNTKGRGKLKRIPSKYCCKNEGTGHSMHAACLALFEASTQTRCPRCVDLENRLAITNSNTPCIIPYKRWCTNIKAMPFAEPGFVPSTKLVQIRDHIEAIPKEDKILVFSFFKGALDLLEGTLIEDLGIRCARYDGDMNQDERKRELEHFKDETRGCRVLLATIHSCGVGLNIVEANHVIFVDRWFNPTVHDQALCRSYRLGQTKDVHVSYFDCAYTLDMAMRMTNEYKTKNSAIILADGTDLGEGNMNFHQLHGVMRGVIIDQRRCRQQQITQAGTSPLIQLGLLDNDKLSELMVRVMELANAKGMKRKKKK